MRSRWKWSAEDLLRLEELIARGWTDAKIGEALGCSAVAVQVIRKRKGIPSRRRAILSARAVASKLGVSCSKTVAWWIRAGYLRGRRGQRAGPNRMWYVTEEALLAFLDDPHYWHLWEPAGVDDSLRSWVTDIRNGDRFLSTGQVGAVLGVGHKAVWGYINRGLISGVRRGNWLVREADLRAFVPLCERSRKGRPVRRFSPAEDARLLAMRATGATWFAIASAMGRPLGSIAGRWKRLQAKRLCQRAS